MVYAIAIVLIIIALFIFGSIWRKRIYDAVDQLESWKIDIMDRDVAVQLSQIKTLNLLGETLEKFEGWKTRWEDIIATELLEVEEMLFDAEEAADRYRFSKAKKVLHETEQKLNLIEADIEKILTELSELMESEEVSREGIEYVEPTLKNLKRQLSQKRYQYGKAEAKFDKSLDALTERVKTYHELTESGDYIEAKELVTELVTELDTLKEKMDDFPTVYKAQRHEVPQQLDDLQRGMKEMKDDGYRIEFLGYETEIKNYKERIEACKDMLEQGEIEDVKQLIHEIEERIKEMYDALEKEAIAKSYLESQLPSYENVIKSLETSFSETKLEVEKMKSAYHFEDQDLEQYLTLDKTIAQMKSHLDEMLTDMEADDKAHSDLREELEQGYIHIEALQEKHELFKKRIYNLRSDEIEAKDKLIEINDELNEMKRKLKKNNLPGVPNYIWSFMEQATSKNQQVMRTLEKQPLDIIEVQQALDEAQNTVTHTMEKIDLMIDQARLTEEVIQYANRYRSRNDALRKELEESERLFRKYEYELALEKAAKALEATEPGALKKIESNQ